MSIKTNLPSVPNQEKTYPSKTDFLGTKVLVDPETGEEIDTAFTRISTKDFDFDKVWWKQMLEKRAVINNQKDVVCDWLLAHKNKNNEILYTLREIEEATGVSYKTVATTIKMLKEVDFLRQKRYGFYYLNPELAYKGTHKQRMYAMVQYQNMDYEEKELTKEEKKANYMKVAREYFEKAKKLDEEGDENIIDLEKEAQLRLSSESGDVVESYSMKGGKRKK